MSGLAAPPAHVYVSTACYHGEHCKCRNTCKYCDEPCACRECDHTGARDLPEPWVDQARDIARELLRYALSKSEAVPSKLLRRIEKDRALFWLRGEEQSPGEWRNDKEEGGTS